MLHYQNGFKIWSSLRYPTVAFKLTDIGEGIKEVTVKQCHIQPDQRVSQFENICDVESDKATVTITSRFDGLIKKVHFQEGDVIAVGSTLLDIEVDDASEEVIPESARDAEVCDNAREQVATIELTLDNQHSQDNKCTPGTQSTLERPHPSESHLDKALATPAVRRIAKEHGIDINEVQGTGKQGRVTKEDVLVYLNQPRLQKEQPAEEKVASSQPITAYRRVMFKTMTESNRIPTLTLSDEMDVTELEALRRRLKSHLEPDVKLTLLAFLVKAISLSLHRFPILNATLEGDALNYATSHNIAVAVDTPAGLVVPNIKNVQLLSVRQIASKAQRLQRLAADGQLSLADTAGGTFTVSNIGSIAGTVVKPLILPPQVAIVGIGRIRQLPRFDLNDQLKKCSVINASWAADHRVVDGATVARFSNSVKQYLENPGLLVVDA